MTRPDWSTYFLGIARAVAARGDCRRTLTGAVLVRPDNSVASTGYNGVAPGDVGCIAGGCPRGLLSHAELPRFEEGGASAQFDSGPGACVAQHAEQNCLAFTREATAGYTMYVTREPCTTCRRQMRAHRIATVTWPTGSGTP